jgi:histidinol-phosphate aminotransferase
MTPSSRPNRVHGGPDARGRARWDFSTNANAAGPCPPALACVCEADPGSYPDPGYHALCERLAQWHGVAPERILIAASASEFIQRMTAVGAQIAPGPVAVPLHAYGDYAVAARAWGRPIVQPADPSATLSWHCDPSSPWGHDTPRSPPGAAISVLDAVYAPLRLAGTGAWDDAARSSVFELHSPNKALGLTGVRGAYAIAPAQTNERLSPWLDALAKTSPSWPLGAHAVAMLNAWVSPQTQQWLAETRDLLRRWKRSQVDLLRAMGAEVDDSVTNFFCARLPAPCTVRGLRERGIAVRDAESFGSPGWVRLSVQTPEAQARLEAALHAAKLASTSTRRAT